MNIPLSVMHGLLRFFERDENRAVMTRAEFLRGPAGRGEGPVRPPWALGEAEFFTRCSGCPACRECCPQGIIVRGSDGRPVVDFSVGPCTFCGACTSACHAGALFRADEQARPWQLLVTISPNCLAATKTFCRSCREQCPEGAITMRFQTGGQATPVLDPGECNGCGACVSACPVGAITVAPALPGQRQYNSEEQS